jgi:Fe-S-cluster containining protein
VVRAARFLKMSTDAFEARYVYRTKNLIRLRKPRGSQCHFLKDHGCGIHPSKPTQCRTFPFWPDLLDDEEEWDATARYCPGIGVGSFVPLEEVERSLAAMRK